MREALGLRGPKAFAAFEQKLIGAAQLPQGGGGELDRARLLPWPFFPLKRAESRLLRLLFATGLPGAEPLAQRSSAGAATGQPVAQEFGRSRWLFLLFFIFFHLFRMVFRCFSLGRSEVQGLLSPEEAAKIGVLSLFFLPGGQGRGMKMSLEDVVVSQPKGFNQLPSGDSVVLLRGIANGDRRSARKLSKRAPREREGAQEAHVGRLWPPLSLPRLSNRRTPQKIREELFLSHRSTESDAICAAAVFGTGRGQCLPELVSGAVETSRELGAVGPRRVHRVLHLGPLRALRSRGMCSSTAPPTA